MAAHPDLCGDVWRVCWKFRAVRGLLQCRCSGVLGVLGALVRVQHRLWNGHAVSRAVVYSKLLWQLQWQWRRDTGVQCRHTARLERVVGLDLHHGLRHCPPPAHTIMLRNLR